MITEVKPDNGAREGRYLALAIAAILAVGGIALPYHQHNAGFEQLAANEVAVEQLPKQQLGALRELNIAREEVQFWQEGEGRWPSVAELSDEFIAPFSESDWQWQQVEVGTYLGHNGHWSLILDANASQIWTLDSPHSSYQPPLDHFLETAWQQVRFDHGDHH